MKKVFLTKEEKEVFNKFGIDENEKTKSYLLLGTPGTGKSTITRVLADKHNEKIFTAMDLKLNYEKFKSSFIEDVSKQNFVFLDDITIIQENKIFGDSVNIIEEILLARFDNIEQSNHNIEKIIKEIEYLNLHKCDSNYMWCGYKDEEEFTCVLNSKERSRENHLNSSYVTIINSNLSKEDFKEKISARLFDRIKAHLIIIDIDEKSHRKEYIG